jgi:hypothetical protein
VNGARVPGRGAGPADPDPPRRAPTTPSATPAQSRPASSRPDIPRLGRVASFTALSRARTLGIQGRGDSQFFDKRHGKIRLRSAVHVLGGDVHIAEGMRTRPFATGSRSISALSAAGLDLA